MGELIIFTQSIFSNSVIPLECQEDVCVVIIMIIIILKLYKRKRNA